MERIDGIATPDRHHGRGWDRLAISASALCLVHCLVLPLLAAFLPMIAQWAGWGEAFHVAMLGIAVPLSSLTLFAGWRRHRALVPPAIGAAGLALLVAGLVFDGQGLGTALTVAGSIALAVAHIVNLRASNLAILSAL
ncbi:MerC domain-containing protein [Sphingomonas pseudosanguinis]|uniref:MerC domain-containing protein n=1 Tax=Sphingomonas pseudosanguinis TaxID=413712 RepID=UPI003F84F775